MIYVLRTSLANSILWNDTIQYNNYFVVVRTTINRKDIKNGNFLWSAWNHQLYCTYAVLVTNFIEKIPVWKWFTLSLQNTHFALLKQFTRTAITHSAADEHSWLRTRNSKRGFILHASPAWQSLSLPRRRHANSATAPLLPKGSRQNADNLAKMQFTNCFTGPLHSRPVPQDLG